MIELLLVIAIVAILAAMLVPTLSRAKADAQCATCKNNLRQLGMALSMYVDDYSKYPGRPRYSELLIGTLDSEPFDKALFQIAPYVGVPGDRFGDIKLVSPHQLVWHCPSVPPVNLQNLFTLSSDVNLEYVPSYGYNARGTAPSESQVDLGLSPRVVGLLSPDAAASRAILRQIRASDVLVSARMIAFADDSPPSLINDEISPTWPPLGDRHGNGANVVFCDAHVEYGKQSAWIQRTDASRKLWNNDHQPHPETW